MTKNQKTTDKLVDEKAKHLKVLPIFAIIIGLVGLTLLLRSFAAGSDEYFLEPETANLSQECVELVNDTSASGGQAVEFSCQSNGSLDHSGNTIPTTNYAVPSGAIFMSTTGNDANSGSEASPVKTINRAVSLVPSGGTIVLREGEYRDWHHSSDQSSYKIVGKDLTLQPYPAEQVWFNGSDVATGWTSDGSGRWYKDWSTPQFCDGRYYETPITSQPTANKGPCAHFDMDGVEADPQAVFINDQRQQQVGSLSQASSGKFYYDWSNRRIYIGTNPSGKTVELTKRPNAIVLGGGKNYTVRGIGFKKYATNEYGGNLTAGALYIGANQANVENVVFTKNSATGLVMSNPKNNSSIKTSVFVNNGFKGVSSNGGSQSGTRNDFVVSDNVFNLNNAELIGENCTVSCAAGQLHLAHMVGFLVTNNIIKDGQGVSSGVWCDLDCSEGKIINNLVKNNGKHGIFYEVSDTGIIASNLVEDNHQLGIAIASSNTKVWHNTVLIDANTDPLAQAISVYDDRRFTGDIGPNTTGVELVNNIIAGQKGVLVKAEDPKSDPINNTTVEQYFSDWDYNAYWHGGQNIINWKHPSPSSGGLYYKSTASFNAAHGFEANAVDISGSNDPFFVDFASGNYQVRNGSSISSNGKSLPSDVASLLGQNSGANLNRGALSWPTD